MTVLSGNDLKTNCIKISRMMFVLLTLAAILYAVRGLPSFPDFSTDHSEQALLSHDELSAYYQTFWDAFISPANLAQLMSVNSTLFAEDVFGRVDVTRTFVGRELNTEYIFGTFSDNSFNPTVKTLLGAPLSHQTVHFATEDNFVSASEMVLFNTSLIANVIPVEIDLWMLFNERGEIEQYDITFRWFAWLFQSILDSMHQDNSTNGGVNLPLLMAQQICQTALDHCTGSQTQYSSCDECQNFLTNDIRFGVSYELGGNTLLCRNLHAKILPLRPDVHCPHIGPTGGNMCVDDLAYQEVVLQPQFLNTSLDLDYGSEGDQLPPFPNGTGLTSKRSNKR